MLTFLANDAVTDVVDCVPKNIARDSKDIDILCPYKACPLKDFCRFVKSNFLVASSSSCNWLQTNQFLP
jgi:hypothetical protein